MKLDCYDIAMVKGAIKENSRPMLQNIHYNKGRLEVADGFLLAHRDADIEPDEKDLTCLIPTKILKTIKAGVKTQTILSLSSDMLQVTYRNAEDGKPIAYDPTLTFEPYDKGGTKKYPNITNLIPKETTKTSHIALNVGLLKKLLSFMPNNGILRIGITKETEPLEYECSNLDRPIRGLVMPMFTDWKEFQWHRDKDDDEA